MSDALHALLVAVVPSFVRVGWRPIDLADEELLWPAEAALVSNAVPKRRAEFATGRALLRSLLGIGDEILRAANGSPLVPESHVVSLAHDDAVVVAAVAEATQCAAIGIDVEPERTLDAGVEQLVVRPDDDVPDVLTAFVAKESTYKAWSMMGGRMLEHHDVRLQVATGRFEALIGRDQTLSGRVASGAGRVVGAVVVPTDWAPTD